MIMNLLVKAIKVACQKNYPMKLILFHQVVKKLNNENINNNLLNNLTNYFQKSKTYSFKNKNS